MNHPSIKNSGFPYCHCYSVGGINLLVKADLRITKKTFNPKIQLFKTEACDVKPVQLQHHFSYPNFKPEELGKLLYQEIPWSVYLRGQQWIYLSTREERETVFEPQVAIFDFDYSVGEIFHINDRAFQQGNLSALSFSSNDQNLLAQLLADRKGCIFHGAGLAMNGKGFLFLGHSGAGKSTISRMLAGISRPIALDRVIVRCLDNHWLAYGFWDTSELSEISQGPVPLHAILFLEQAQKNTLTPITDRREIIRRLPFFIVKSLVTADWWNKTMDLVGSITQEVPFYHLAFDTSGRVADVLKQIVD